MTDPERNQRDPSSDGDPTGKPGDKGRGTGPQAPPPLQLRRGRAHHHTLRLARAGTLVIMPQEREYTSFRSGNGGASRRASAQRSANNEKL